MLYDLNYIHHQSRMDDLRREAEHERLVRAAKAARRERGRAGARSRLGRRSRDRGEGERVWVPAA
ncbi:hypothetical protein ABZ686_13735 [Streptomyces sp. NPDC006992]|uniref:hypothetical protein n=1 Tax=unclassified Streptomyces TaxID=2593676 RepID=UPI0033D23EF7